MQYLLGFYTDIKTDKPIDYNELQCWSEMTGNPLTNFEIKALRLIDQIQIGLQYD